MVEGSKGRVAERPEAGEGGEEKGENALFYSPYQRYRTRAQIDQDVSQGRVYPLADVLFKFLFGRPERAELFFDLLNALMFPDGERAFTQITFIDRELSPVRASGKGSRISAVLPSLASSKSKPLGFAST